MRTEEAVEAVVLAGTELPLLLRGAEPPGLPFLDTTMIHVQRAVESWGGSDIRPPPSAFEQRGGIASIVRRVRGAMTV